MDKAWDECRRRRRGLLVAILALPLWLVPAGAVQHFLADWGFSATSRVTFVAVVLPPLIWAAVAHLRLMFWRCPRCRRPFHASLFYGNVLARRCVHCGTSKETPKHVPAEADFA